LAARPVNALLADLRTWWGGRRKGETVGLAGVVQFLYFQLARTRDRLAGLRRRRAEFTQGYARAATEEDKRQQILDFARDLGAGRWQLRGDRRAFRRWFGPDAVTERCLRRQAEAERALAFCLDRLGVLAAALVGQESSAKAPAEVWRQLGLEAALRPLFFHDGDARVRIAALRSLAAVLRALPPGTQQPLVAADTLTYVYRAALDAREHVWIQCEALCLIPVLSPADLPRMIEHRLRQPGEGDELFVRRRAVALLGENLPRLPELVKLIPLAGQDSSPFVRQQLAHAVLAAPPETTRAWLWHLARRDPVAQVRAAAVREALALLGREDLAAELPRLLIEVMGAEEDEFVLRVAVHAAGEVVGALAGAGAGSALLSAWQGPLTAALARLNRQAPSVAVRRWAAQARERIWCLTDPQARALNDRLRAALAGLPQGRSRRLPRRWLRGCPETVVGRVLSVLAQEDFGLDLEWRWWGARLTRGHVFRFRLWRFLHELRHSDPAKRQAFRHTVGRVSYANVRAPSAILSELAETKVPGEPLFLSKEGGWRPYLPLVDDVLSSLNQVLWVRPVRFYTSEGVTELRPPRSFAGRLWAYFKINLSYPHFARLRNWREGDPANPAAYLQALARLGFRLRFSPHEQRPGSSLAPDPAVTRFFPEAAETKPQGTVAPPTAAASLLPLLSLSAGFPAHASLVGERLSEWVPEFVSYFKSLFENTLPELTVFSLAALALFLGRHWFLNRSMRRARGQFSLVVGGWGTRGKSGTERLKAALMSALGYNLFSKTTGCEAMFLHAPSFRPTRELFLYRSYDKATIWEQRNVVRIAHRLGAEVFLWECMGLNPAYVKILQRHWMRDDIATITNTYPDHEDIQGPAGINIPEVMTRFIPPGARLLTSEEQMRPILAEAANQLRTSLRGVGWLEAGLLAPDVLKRFPYEEHPYNIALVLALAGELGIGPDFALKEMADRVVPDLGVLKTSPPAPLRTRRLEFSNGMSANERHGCLNNWVRLGFDRQDPDAEPGVWLTTVVNNRADRIPRSRVFAAILVNDISADRHFLIGGNLTGLVRYVREAWEEAVRQITLWPDSGATSSDPLHALEAAARRFRLPVRPETIRARLRVMAEAVLPGPAAAEILAAEEPDPAGLRQRLQAAGADPLLAEAAAQHYARDLQTQQEYRAFADRVRQAAANQRADLDRAFHALLWKWFQDKLVVIADYHASGDQIIDRICAETPPGFRNRIMGIQNIKGTGLDFVYRWEAWHACHRACALLRSPQAALAEQGLRELAAFQDYGIVCEEYVRETVRIAQQFPHARREDFQAQLRLILSQLDDSMQALRERLARGSQGSGRLARIVSAVEAFFDAGDAVRRRRRANRIYADLIAERISPERAALELQALNSRQKGGWLWKKLTGLGRWWKRH
jgi:poly-gamma-glutamate synthase PgsB/CapB